MRGKFARFAACLALWPLSGCGQKPEVDQIAQHSFIGLPEKKVLACLGAPSKRTRVGSEQIWTFPIGHMHTEGGLLALGLNAYATPFSDAYACNVNVVISRYGVSQIFYTKADGGALPVGQQCLYDAHAYVSQ